MNSRLNIWLSMATCLLVVTASCRKQPAGPQVTINGSSWRVELATTAAQKYRGLSGRPDLPADRGMLFVYPSAGMLEFCMRGCLIPLDIAFISADHRVVAVHTMSVEPDLAGRKVYSSKVPAQFALELQAGQLALAGVKLGAVVTFAGEISDAAKADPGP